MKEAKYILFCALVLCSLVLFGCGKKADESKPIGEVKAEAEQMDLKQLKAMATKYKEAILAKQPEIKKLTDKLKEIPVTKMLGEEAKEIKAEIDALNKSVSALKERFQVYYDKLKEQGGDLSGLEI
jgi:uncharacterized coiled-coil DUF342 family protein